MNNKRSELRRLIHASEILITPGVYDAFSAKMVQKAGFKTASISGAGVSESRLGMPDRGIMGYDRNVETSRDLAACTDLLLQADADTGYGNALNVYFTVRGFEDAGVAAVMIEDQVWPKRCGHMAGKAVIAAEEMVEKVRAACEARRDKELVIKARTDAAGVHGVAEAIRRLNLYAEAGADCLFADALLSEEDIATVAKNVSKPLSVNMGLGIRERRTTPLIHPKRLEELGVAQISYPRLLSAAAMSGMGKALDAFSQMLESNQVIHRPDLLVSFEELNDLMGLSELSALEDRFSSTTAV